MHKYSTEIIIFRRSKKLQLLAHSSFEAEDHLIAKGDRPRIKRFEDQQQLLTKKQMEANLKVRLNITLICKQRCVLRKIFLSSNRQNFAPFRGPESWV